MTSAADILNYTRDIHPPYEITRCVGSNKAPKNNLVHNLIFCQTRAISKRIFGSFGGARATLNYTLWYLNPIEPPSERMSLWRNIHTQLERRGREWMTTGGVAGQRTSSSMTAWYSPWPHTSPSFYSMEVARKQKASCYLLWCVYASLSYPKLTLLSVPNSEPCSLHSVCTSALVGVSETVLLLRYGARRHIALANLAAMSFCCKKKRATFENSEYLLTAS